MKRPARIAALVLLVVLLVPMLGVEGAQLSEEQAVARASSDPTISPALEVSGVESSARYSPRTDVWRVVFTRGESGPLVARATVSDDDGGEVEQARVVSEEGGADAGDLDRAQAIKVAEANEKVREELSQHGGYTTTANLDDGVWTVSFYTKGTVPIGGVPQDDGTKEVARVEVNEGSWVVESAYVGDQVGWNMARGTYGSYGKQANYWYVWGPMALVFFLAFFRNDRLLSLRNLDLVVLLSFLVSHSFFRQGIVEEAVVLWYPPLVYLFFRCTLMGFGIGERVQKTSNFPTWLLVALAAISAGFVLALNTDARVIDVGYAGVAGGQLILDGNVPYGNMPDDVGTGDTYGPLNYLLYVPFILMFGYSGEWDFLPAAHALTSFCFVAGGLAMFYCGWRFSGAKAGAAMVFAWSIFPYTIYATNNNTNDVIVASIAAIGLAAASSPLARGAVIAAGFATKLYPLALGPLWLLHGGFKRRPVTDFIIGGVAVVLMTFWVLLLQGSPLQSFQLFYEKTLAFQGDRVTPWTIFSQVPALGFLQTPLTVFTVLFAVFVAVFPKKRTIRRLAAFSAAIVILFQMTVNYWFYAYVIWFEPFVFVTLLLATNDKTELDGGVSRRDEISEKDSEALDNGTTDG